MNDFGRAATLGGLVTAGGSGLAYLSTLSTSPTTDLGAGFLIAAALLLLGYIFGGRHTALAAGWAIPAVAGVLVLIEPTVSSLREVSLLLALVGLATAIAWPAVSRGLVVFNRFGERFWE